VLRETLNVMTPPPPLLLLLRLPGADEKAFKQKGAADSLSHSLARSLTHSPATALAIKPLVIDLSLNFIQIHARFFKRAIAHTPSPRT
jgi:hypothetical protein